MPLISSAKGGSDFEPVPAGVHLARCITVVDLGMQETTWSGKVSYKHKVYIAWEIPGVRVEWEKDDVKHEGPALIGQTFTNSIGEKSNLGKHLVNWRGREFTPDERDAFDLFNVVDKPCQLSVVHVEKNGKVYANIGSIMGIIPGMEIPAREQDILLYTPSDPVHNDLSKMPEWLQEKCRKGHKLNPPQDNHPPPPGPGGDFDDDIPF